MSTKNKGSESRENKDREEIWKELLDKIIDNQEKHNNRCKHEILLVLRKIVVAADLQICGYKTQRQMGLSATVNVNTKIWRNTLMPISRGVCLLGYNNIKTEDCYPADAYDNYDLITSTLLIGWMQ